MMDINYINNIWHVIPDTYPNLAQDYIISSDIAVMLLFAFVLTMNYFSFIDGVESDDSVTAIAAIGMSTGIMTSFVIALLGNKVLLIGTFLVTPLLSIIAYSIAVKIIEKRSEKLLLEPPV
jgi:hypothetical protein